MDEQAKEKQSQIINEVNRLSNIYNSSELLDLVDRLSGRFHWGCVILNEDYIQEYFNEYCENLMSVEERDQYWNEEKKIYEPPQDFVNRVMSDWIDMFNSTAVWDYIVDVMDDYMGELPRKVQD